MFTLVETAYAAQGSLSIHLAPEVVGTFFGVPITSTLLTSWLAMGVLIVIAFIIKQSLKLVPGYFQSTFEAFIGTVYEYVVDTLESKKHAQTYFPVVMTIFIFVLAINWIGMLPGMDSIGIYKNTTDAMGVRTFIPFFHSASTDLNVTLAIAIVSFVVTEFAGVVVVGLFKYVGKFINFKSPLAFVIGIIELISELVRLVAFSFRLFGNIFAGETLMLVVMYIATPYLLPVPFMMYEAFVGFIQAFIFAILTLYFIKLAITEPH